MDLVPSWNNNEWGQTEKKLKYTLLNTLTPNSKTIWAKYKQTFQTGVWN